MPRGFVVFWMEVISLTLPFAYKGRPATRPHMMVMEFDMLLQVTAGTWFWLIVPPIVIVLIGVGHSIMKLKRQK